MPKIIALDFGAKRTGIAETDSLQLIASGLTTVSAKDLHAFIDNYLKTEEVECMVIGQAIKRSGELSDIEQVIIPFINFVKKRFPSLPIIRVDEGFTSQIAFQTMIDGGLSKKKRKDKALVDKISATLILQRFMEDR